MEDDDDDDAIPALPAGVITLIPKRLYMGPLPRKDTISVYDLVRHYGISDFVNVMPKPKLWAWKCHSRSHENAQYVCAHSRGRAFALSQEDPPKDLILFKFVSSLRQEMVAKPNMRLYIYDREGQYCAGLVALTLWYFLQDKETKETFDPVALMKRLGKHHVVPNRKKAFVLQIQRMCEKDKKSIHRHLFKVKGPPKKRSKT